MSDLNEILSSLNDISGPQADDLMEKLSAASQLTGNMQDTMVDLGDATSNEHLSVANERLSAVQEVLGGIAARLTEMRTDANALVEEWFGEQNSSAALNNHDSQILTHCEYPSTLVFHECATTNSETRAEQAAQEQPPAEEIARESSETKHFLEHEAQFHSEMDREIALDILSKLSARCEFGRISPTEYLYALASLRALTPVDNGHGKRKINGRTISPAQERLIASRLKSKEVDITGPDSGWGRLPQEVRREICRRGSGIQLELTSNCTVGCSFCSFAAKGPIAAKASFDSAASLIKEYTAEQSTRFDLIRSDTLYWNTDPFDVKWPATSTAPERDYSDIARVHRNLRYGGKRSLFTSTAVPLGEEMRVLKFADDYIERTEILGQPRVGRIFSTPQVEGRDKFRLSMTKRNEGRVLHILRVLDALNPNGLQGIILNRTSDHTAVRGKDKWSKHEDSGDVSAWDVLGPNCRDGIIMSVGGMRRVIMQGASPERPDGELSLPIQEAKGDETIYTIPHHAEQPPLTNNSRLRDMKYPATTVTKIRKIAGHQGAVITQRVIRDDPHRSLLNLANVLVHIEEQERTGGALSEEQIHDFWQLFIRDVRICGAA